ncbi:hypothetical protein GCM10010915_01820 [Microbacterium faecale]|uniref:Metal ABC transporter substrate-binding protein n=1 Tax=Microbacterium faecale TaxID=1804630 RepID=A0A916Y1L5_9MICO|nr:zinc ABC transporter substrate-binding protein [Microbacterium faecale]GGD25499.1 hypothetical protein GCM10010915_01820 [Microbacterium faecale]
MPRHRAVLSVTLAGLTAFVLAGCTSAQGVPSGSDDDGLRIVSSTTVYADLAQRIVGETATVEAVIDSAAVDPHDYEATARDGLAVRDADVVIMNGGGYDAFMHGLIESAGVEHVIAAVDFHHGSGDRAHDDDHEEGAEAGDHDHDHGHGGDHDHDHGHGGDHDHDHSFNEHVWYDPHTMIHLVEGVAAELADLAPEAAEVAEEGSAALISELEDLETRLSDIADEHAGDTAFFTEPVGGYFAAAAGLEDVTVDGFAEAVENGEGVAPAVLNDALKAIESGEVTVLIANAHTGGSETDRVIAAAEDSDVPVVEFTETIPDGSDYVTWMTGNADALSDALS